MCQHQQRQMKTGLRRGRRVAEKRPGEGRAAGLGSRGAELGTHLCSAGIHWSKQGWKST